jgi:hypothetical protein
MPDTKKDLLAIHPVFFSSTGQPGIFSPVFLPFSSVFTLKHSSLAIYGENIFFIFLVKGEDHMSIVKYAGIFLFLCGIVLLSGNRKVKKGGKTWESEHGIHIPTPVCIILVIAGFLAVFGSNFHAKVSVAGPDGVEETLISAGGDTEVVDTEAITAPMETETQEATEITETVPVDVPEGTESPAEPGSAAGSDIITLPFVRAVELDLSGMDYQLEDYALYLTPDESTEVMYSDSFVDTGDEDQISSGMESILEVYGENVAGDVSTYTWTINGTPDNYSMFLQTDYGCNKLWLYQDIGGDTYLLVTVTDYTGTLTEDEMVSAYAIAISE